MVVDYLKVEDNEKLNYLEKLKDNGDMYNGFTLVTIDQNRMNKNYSLSSFSNRSNCLKLNQSNQSSFIFTNSMRPNYPWFRGIVFKKEFDEILSKYRLINDSTNDLSYDLKLTNLLASHSSNNNSKVDTSDLAKLNNNDQTNERANVQINDSHDNLKDSVQSSNDCSKDSPMTFECNANRMNDCCIQNSTSTGICSEICQKNCLIKRNCSKNKKNKTNEKLNSTDKKYCEKETDEIDFTKTENQQKLVENLLELLLSERNYYEEEQNGDYFRTQNCLTNEISKKALSSLCISLPEYNYGSRYVIISIIIYFNLNQSCSILLEFIK